MDYDRIFELPSKDFASDTYLTWRNLTVSLTIAVKLFCLKAHKYSILQRSFFLLQQILVDLLCFFYVTTLWLFWLK